VRRVVEGLSAWLPVSMLLFVPLLFAIPQIYEWSSPDHVHLHGEKHFIEQWFLACDSSWAWIWIGMGCSWSATRSVDKSGETRFFLKNRTLSPPFLILFALT